MSEETNKDWQNELVENIIEELSTVCRFKTHKQRKTMLGNIAFMLKDAVNKNTHPKNLEARTRGLEIARPNNKAQTGFAMMTEGNSGRGDETTKQTGERHAAQSKGIRTW